MKILSMPSPAYFVMEDGREIHGWADDEGLLCPITYEPDLGGLVVTAGNYLPRKARHGQHSPFGRHLDDVPERLRAELDGRGHKGREVNE